MQSDGESSAESKNLERTFKGGKPAKALKANGKKVPQKVIEEAVCQALDGNPSEELVFMRRMPKLLVCRTVDSSDPLIFEVDFQLIAKQISAEYAAGHLWNFLSQVVCAGDWQFKLTMGQCRSVITAWMATRTHLRKIPASVGFKNGKDIVLSRLPFVPDMTIKDLDTLRMKAPFFAEMCTRIMNHKAFCARIGSTYDKKADRKQAVWIHGPTDGGKSDIGWLITQLAGKSYTRLSNTDLSGKYWKLKLVGKRVVIISEAATKFIRSEEFKEATGEGEMSVEGKYMNSFNAEIDSMFFFISNHKPVVPDDDAFKGRVIPVFVGAIDKSRMLSVAEVRRNLTRELPQIAGYCMNLWKNTNGRIDCDQSLLEEVIENWDGDYSDFVDSYLITEHGAYITAVEIKKIAREFGFTETRQLKRVYDVIQKMSPTTEDKRIWFNTEADGVKRRIRCFTNMRKRKEAERRYTAFATDDET